MEEECSLEVDRLLAINSSNNPNNSAVISLRSSQVQDPTAITPKKEQNEEERKVLGSSNNSGNVVLSGISFEEWNPQRTTPEPAEMVSEDKETLQSPIEQQPIL